MGEDIIPIILDFHIYIINMNTIERSIVGRKQIKIHNI